jgi:hypothetical protein
MRWQAEEYRRPGSAIPAQENPHPELVFGIHITKMKYRETRIAEIWNPGYKLQNEIN